MIHNRIIHSITNPLTLDLIHEEPYVNLKQVQPIIETLVKNHNMWKQVKPFHNLR